MNDYCVQYRLLYGVIPFYDCITSCGLFSMAANGCVRVEPKSLKYKLSKNNIYYYRII